LSPLPFKAFPASQAGVALLGFDYGSAYAVAAYVAAAILLWAAVFREGRNLFTSVRRKVSPPPPAPLPKPALVVGAAGGSINLGQETGEPHRRLVKVEPRYLVENKGPTVIRELDTGVESFDRTRSHQFEEFHAPALAPGETIWVENVGSIPREMLDDVHESDAFVGHFYWVTFEDVDGNHWKAIYDPRDRSHDYELLSRAT
jgi:hypothetical protein